MNYKYISMIQFIYVHTYVCVYVSITCSRFHDLVVIGKVRVILVNILFVGTKGHQQTMLERLCYETPLENELLCYSCMSCILCACLNDWKLSRGINS